MANIRENYYKGRFVSFTFTVSLGKDTQGKYIRRYKNWTPPKGMTPAKASKEAKKQAEIWETALREEAEREPPQTPVEIRTPDERATDERRDDFVEFIDKVWFPLRVSGNDRKAKTVQFYEGTTKIIKRYFAGRTLQEITALDIERYLVYLRTEYKGRFGKPLAAKTIHHQYRTLHLIFTYAQKRELIQKNPMAFVDAPKKPRKPVDALTQEQTKEFLKAIEACPLDFRCMLSLLITTGIRRGECIGLKWKDIDESDSVLSVRRSVSYTPKVGLVVSTPKTGKTSWIFAG